MINKNTKMFLFMVTLLVLIVGLTAVTATDSSNQTTNTATTPSVTPTTDTTVSTTSSLTTNTQDNDVKDTTTTKETTKTNIIKNTNTVKTSTPTTKNTTSTTTKKAISTNVNNYQELYDAVETAKTSNDNSYTINLNKGTYNIDNPINWANTTTGTLKNLTINGNNQTISGQGTKNFITVNPGYTLNLNNITIIKTNDTVNGFEVNGSAVFSNGTLNIKNSTFNNNYGETVIFSLQNTNIMGSIITNSPNSTGLYFYANNAIIRNNTINNTNESLISFSDTDTSSATLSNNIISNNTLGINTAANLTCINNTFTGNKRAIFINGYSIASGYLANPIFINNTIIKNAGGNDNTGLIFCRRSNGTFINNIISNNTMYDDPGMIFNSGLLTFINNTITNNSDIKFYLIDNTGVQVFINNTIKNNGASSSIIYNEVRGSQEFINNSIIGNHAESIIDNMGVQNITGNSIINNTVDIYGTIYNRGSQNITNNNITNNKAYQQYDATYGGAIYNNGTQILTNNNISYNNATYGGAIYNIGNQTITNNTFINNTAKGNITLNYLMGVGGAIYNKGYLNLINNTLNNNSAYNYGGAIYDEGPENLIILNNTLSYNKAGFDGGAIYNNGTQTTIINNTITNSSAKNYGGAIYNNGNQTIINNNITDNYAGKFGGAIYNNGTQTIINNTFNINDADYGGAIYNNGTQTITNNTISDNAVYIGGAYFGEGGAIYNNGIQNITNNIFNNNTAGNGGVIYNNGTQNITNNTFINNNENINTTMSTQSSNGGVIYNNGTQNITNNIFNNNSADYGGVIYNYGFNYIINNTFTNNSVVYDGAVYYCQGSSSQIPITGAIFTNNTVCDNIAYNYSYDGTTIRNGSGILVPGVMNITNNLFINNTDGYDILIPESYCNVSGNIYIGNLLNDEIVPIKNSTVIADHNYEYINITMNLRPIYNDTIRNGTITVYLNGNQYKTENITNGNLIIKLPVGQLKTGINNITLKYYSSERNYQNTTSNFIISLNKLNTTITVNPVTGIVGNNYELQANVVTKENGTPVTGGIVIFKINNLTLKDESGNPIKVNVNNGVAKYNITLPAYFSKENMTISAVYSGTLSLYNNSRSNTSNITVVKRNATIIVITSPINKAEDKITLTANVTDKLTNKTVNSGVVVFKYQGHTITDESGNPILVNVTNGIAKLDYTIPKGMSSHNYTIEAIYSNRDYNGAENTTKQFINKTETKITFNATENTPGSTPRTITLKGNITDLKNTQVVGTNKVCIKINGKTLTDSNNKTVYYNIIDGNIDLNITTDYTGTIKNITIITGERNGYYGSTGTTTTNLTKTTKTSINELIKV